MGTIGFNASADITHNKPTVDELEKYVQGIGAEVSSVKDELLQELKKVKDLQRNLKVLSRVVAKAKEDAAHGKEAIFQLAVLTHRPGFDVEKAEELLKEIGHYDILVQQRIELVDNEVHRHLLTDAAEVYKAEKGKEKRVQELDLMGRQILAEVRLLHNEWTSHSSYLQNIQAKIQKEKRLTPQERKRIKGFAQD